MNASQPAPVSECRLSIVIPAHDARSTLAHCLDALVPAASRIGAELIVVDDASGDGTPELALARGARVLRQERNAGPSAARNLGAARARGEYLFFVDADVVVHEDAVTRVVEFLDGHPEVAAVFGSYDAQPRARGLVTRYRNLVHHYVHQHGDEDASSFWAGCGAIRRAVFAELGGFDEADYPRCIEDIELGYRLRRGGHAVHLDKGLLGTHLKRWTLLSMIRTDVFCRAIPWTRLNLRRKAAPNDLNIKRSQQLSVVLTGLFLAFAAAGLLAPWLLAGAGLALLLILALNAGLFRFFVEVRGLGFAFACVPLHLLYFTYSGLCFAYVQVAERLGVHPADGNSLKPKPARSSRSGSRGRETDQGRGTSA